MQSLIITLTERVTKLESLVEEIGSRLTERVTKLESLVEEIGSEDEFEDELDTKKKKKKRKIR